MNTQNYAQPYYWYYATREEALKWPIAPGNMLTFKDPDGKHYYEKSLGWSPYEGVKFTEYHIQESGTGPIVQETTSSVAEVKPNSEVEDLRKDIYDLKDQIAELVKLQSVKPYYNKKGDNK